MFFPSKTPVYLRAMASLALAGALSTSGCGDDITEASAGNVDEGTGGETGGDGDGDGDTGGDGDGDGDGSIQGIVSFNYYPADASGAPEQVGFSAGFRNAAFVETEDFHAALAFDLTIPTAPETLDEVTFLGVPTPLDWGKSNIWITGGDGINLFGDDASISACRIMVGIESEFPVYTASDAPMFGPECAPELADFVFDGSYTLGVFGGDAFADRTFANVTTPANLDITAPDVATYALATPLDSALDVTWEANGSADDVVVLRLWDVNGNVLAVSATDDGEFSIPPGDLGQLSPGLATLTITRERGTRRSFGDGTGEVLITTRVEVWGYLDLQ